MFRSHARETGGASPTSATESSCDCSCSQVRRLVRLVV